MSPEEFERLKEQEKAHLRKLKELKGQLHHAKRQNRLSQTLRDIAGAVEPDATYDEMLEKLTLETAQQEARFEIAQENVQAAEPDALEKAAEAEKQEAELSKARARALVEQMKSQMGGPARTAPPDPDMPKTLGRSDAPESSDTAPPVPPAEKTLGRRP